MTTVTISKADEEKFHQLELQVLELWKTGKIFDIPTLEKVMGGNEQFFHAMAKLEDDILSAYSPEYLAVKAMAEQEAQANGITDKFFELAYEVCDIMHNFFQSSPDEVMTFDLPDDMHTFDM